MGLLAWLRALGSGARQLGTRGERITVRGVVQAIESVRSPVSGEWCVAIDYAASVPAEFGILMGGVTRHEVACRQAYDFIVRDGKGGLLVRVDGGVDVKAFHAGLVARHGLDVQSDESVIREGDVVQVSGVLTEVCDTSPHRREPYRAVITAESFSLAR